MIGVSLYGFFITYLNNFDGRTVYYPFIISIFFFISIVNIPIIVVSATTLFVKRQRVGIAAFILASAILFIIFGKITGDAW
jgi:hypothetical protein